MATPAEVSEKRSNFRIRQLMLNTMVSFVILLIARTARIACADRHTDTRDNYFNPRCACVPRVISYGTFVYLLRAHISNINMPIYVHT